MISLTRRRILWSHAKGHHQEIRGTLYCKARRNTPTRINSARLQRNSSGEDGISISEPLDFDAPAQQSEPVAHCR
jgi:hypothetical protein